MNISPYQIRIVYNDNSRRIINISQEFFLNINGDKLTKTALKEKSLELSMCNGPVYRIILIYEGNVHFKYVDKINKPGSNISKYVKMARKSISNLHIFSF